MKTIFLSCFHPFVSRNILNTDAFRILKNQKDIKIVIFTHEYKKDFINKYYSGANIEIEGIDLDKIIRSSYNKFWYRLAFLLQNSFYIQDQRKTRLYEHRNIIGYLNYFLVNTSASILSHVSALRGVYRFLDFIFSPKEIFKGYFLKYKPDLFFSTDIFSEYDALFLRQAKKAGIKTIGMVRSWDNTTTKGVLRIIPNKAIVNSKLAKEEAVRFHSVSEKIISVVGLPQFDSFIKGPTLSREEFFSKIGVNPKKRLILFAPAGKILSDTDWQICRILKDAIKDGALPDDIQFLVRNHPSHPADFSKFEADENFIIENPGTKFGTNVRVTEINPDDESHLRNSVFYSDIIIYIATSLGLDAAVFNKPQIIVSFDGWEKKDYEISVKRYHNEDNIRSLIIQGGTRVVENKKDLILWINNYLTDPAIDQDGRDNIVRNHLFSLDGKAGERIANLISAQLTSA
ncbi:MAG: CDP-glycerol glycerophosphotransferase family protein [Patescibacteria group bacterium]